MSKKKAPEQPLALTTRQQEVFEFIKSNRSYVSPTVREIGKAFSIRSPQGVVCHLRALQRKGWIRVSKRRQRNIEVIHGD